MITIKQTDKNNPDAIVLINELNSVLLTITGNSGAGSFKVTDNKDSVYFIILYDDNKPIACGALRKLNSTSAEIKRVYARKNNIGAGRRIASALEQKAIEQNYSAIYLETRKINSHAIDFYIKMLYNVTENYGKYIGRDEAICFIKQLNR